MRRAQLLQALTFALLLLVMGVQFHEISRNRSLANQGRQAHAALCVFKADLYGRILAGQAFLDTHPGGIPGLATATEIRNSLENQRATYDSLRLLVCVP